MKAFAELYRDLETVVRRHLEGIDGCHDFDHTQRVVANAKMLLGRFPGADRETVLLAALLHDIARPEEQRSQGAVCHAAKGAEMAAELLVQAGVPSHRVEAVAAAIAAHRYRGKVKPETPEGKILSDADKLDAVGAVGLGRAFLFAGRTGARLHNTETEALAGAAYGREDTAYREYLVKLCHLPEAMLTEPGREIAAERVAFMAAFFERLDAEIASVESVVPESSAAREQ